MAMDPRVKAGIFAGESGGDYGALFGFSNRPGGQFAGTNLQGMTVDQAIQFADPNGPYGSWVKGKIGKVSTPMGAYQIVGTTLKAAKDWLGLKGDELMTPELQDRLGEVILAKQGTGAWEGYKGPRAAGSGLRHVGGAGSKPGNFAPTSGGGGGTVVAGGGGQYQLPPETPKKAANEKLGEAIKTLGGDLTNELGMGQAPSLIAGQFAGGEAIPSVMRQQFQPTSAPMPSGGGGDLRAILAQLLAGGGGGNV